jgi:hypothetical protein
MSFRSFSHRALAFLVALVALCASSRAFAATIALSPTVNRDHFRNNTNIGSSTTFWISRTDCLVDDVLHFTTTTTDASSLQLEVWVGLGSADCLQKVNRDPATTAQCLRIFSGPATPAVQQINLSTQDIAQIEQPVPPGRRGQDGIGTGTAADCSRTGSTAPDDVTLFFMLMQSSDQVASTTFTTKIDLVGPIAPTNPAATSGNTLVEVTWTANIDADVAGYTVFCVPPPGSPADAGFSTSATATTSATTSVTSGGGAGGAAGAGGTVDSGDDAGADGSAGADGTGGTADAAGSSGATSSIACGGVVPFVPGELPSADVLSRFVCATVTDRLATHAKITGFVNGEVVALAVGANDIVQNVGGLSTVVCATPDEVNGFDTNYHAAGGTAGGGFCSLSQGALRGKGWGSIGGFALILMVWAARRRSLIRSN